VCGIKVKRTDKGINCDGACSRWYHAKCKNINENRYKILASNNNMEWTCERDDCTPAPNLTLIQAEISKLSKSMETALSSHDKEIKDFKQSLSSDKFDEWKQEMDEMKSLKEEVTKMIEAGNSSKTENALEKTNRELEEDHQHSTLNNIKISGVPESRGENSQVLKEVICKVVNATGVEVDQRDLNAFHRLPSSNTGSKPIVVSFVSRWKKEEILENIRSKKLRLTTTDAGITGASTTSVYINEHLTKYNENLTKHARDLRKAKKILYTWVRNGKVYIKENEGSKSQRISCLDDFKNGTSFLCKFVMEVFKVISNYIKHEHAFY